MAYDSDGKFEWALEIRVRVRSSCMTTTISPYRMQLCTVVMCFSAHHASPQSIRNQLHSVVSGHIHPTFLAANAFSRKSGWRSCGEERRPWS